MFGTIFQNIFTGSSDPEAKNTQSPDTNSDTGPIQPNPSVEPDYKIGEHVPPEDLAFKTQFVDVDEQQIDKEIKVVSDDGEIYAGDWPRRMYHSKYRNPTEATWVGYQESNTKGAVEVPISFRAWKRHAAIFGSTGNGKTTLLTGIINQVAWAGYGFVYIDPKGDGIVNLLKQIPPHRTDDIIWVEPNPNTDKISALNFLEISADPGDDDYEDEIDAMYADLRGILRGGPGDNYWGEKMDGICSTLARALAKADEPYTLYDMYYLLLDRDYLDRFTEEIDDPDVRRYAEKIVEMDDKELDPVVRRLKKMVENKTSREVIAHRNSTFNINQAIEDGKIILVKNDVRNETVRKFVSTGIIRRVWSAIRARDALDEDEDYTPYFAFIDEFDDIADKSLNIRQMLSKARSLGLRVVLCNQNPSQLNQNVIDGMMANCKTKLAMDVGKDEDARLIMKGFGDKTAQDLTSLGKYEMWTQILVGSDKKPPFVTQTFPDYPFVRDMDGVNEIIQNSLDTYGVDRREGDRQKDLALFNKDDVDTPQPGQESPGVETDAIEQNRGQGTTNDEDEDEPAEVDQETVLESVFAVSTRQDKDWVTSEDVRSELSHRLGDIGYQSLSSNVIETIPETLCEKRRSQGQFELSLTREGESVVLSQDTGSAGTGGGDEHRYVLKRAYKTFTKAGYSTRLPSQDEGGALPDGIADVPIDSSASTMKEMRRKYKQLQEDYPEIIRISDGEDIFIEAETSTIKKPKQTLRNLRKALEADRLCAFCVKDMSHEGTLEKHARTGIKILKDPPLYSKFTYNDDGSVRDKLVYKESKAMKISDEGHSGTYPVIPADIDGPLEWWERWDGSVELVDTATDRAVMEFDNTETAATPSEEHVPAYQQYDKSTGEYIVADKINQQRWTYQSKSEFERDWQKVYRPFIPSEELPRMPNDDDWKFIVFPDDDKDIPVMECKFEGFDDNGNIETELVPLLGDEELITDQPDTTEPDTPDPSTSEQLDTSDETENNTGEAKHTDNTPSVSDIDTETSQDSIDDADSTEQDLSADTDTETDPDHNNQSQSDEDSTDQDTSDKKNNTTPDNTPSVEETDADENEDRFEPSELDTPRYWLKAESGVFNTDEHLVHPDTTPDRRSHEYQSLCGTKFVKNEVEKCNNIEDLDSLCSDCAELKP